MHETCYQHHLPPFQPGPQLVAELVETGSGTICWKPAGEQHETCETVVGWIRYGPCNSIGNVAEVMGHRLQHKLLDTCKQAATHGHMHDAVMLRLYHYKVHAPAPATAAGPGEALKQQQHPPSPH